MNQRYKKIISIFLFVIDMLVIIFSAAFEVNICADEYDSKEVVEIMADSGLYDVWNSNKLTYPYYVLIDYRNADFTSGQYPEAQNTDIQLIMFSSKPDYVIPYGGNWVAWSYLHFSEPAKVQLYNCRSGNVSKGEYYDSETLLSIATTPLIGSNFNLINEDGSYFFGLTSHNPTLTSTSIRRTLLKPIVYLVRLVAGCLILVIALRKAWAMLRTVLHLA